jgi:hypothetical protein
MEVNSHEAPQHSEGSETSTATKLSKLRRELIVPTSFFDLYRSSSGESTLSKSSADSGYGSSVTSSVYSHLGFPRVNSPSCDIAPDSQELDHGNNRRPKSPGKPARPEDVLLTKRFDDQGAACVRATSSISDGFIAPSISSSVEYHPAFVSMSTLSSHDSHEYNIYTQPAGKNKDGKGSQNYYDYAEFTNSNIPVQRCHFRGLHFRNDGLFQGKEHPERGSKENPATKERSTDLPSPIIINRISRSRPPTPRCVRHRLASKATVAVHPPSLTELNPRSHSPHPPTADVHRRVNSTNSEKGEDFVKWSLSSTSPHVWDAFPCLPFITVEPPRGSHADLAKIGPTFDSQRQLVEHSRHIKNDLQYPTAKTEEKYTPPLIINQPAHSSELESSQKAKLKEEKMSTRISSWADGVYTTGMPPSAPVEAAQTDTTIPTPEIFSFEFRSDRGTDVDRSSSGLSDIYGDNDSIFGLDDYLGPPDWEWDTTGSTIERIYHDYANFLFSAIMNRQSNSRLAPTTDGNNDGSSASSHTNGDSSSNPNSSPQDRQGKRKLNPVSNGSGDNRSNQYGEEEEEDGSRPTKHVKRAVSNGCPSRRLACPFFKRHPQRFRSCGFADHENTSRVKQHIQRHHRRPIYCPKCSTVFKKEDIRDRHVRENICEVRPEEQWVSVTVEQLEQLSKRSTCKTDRENWNAIFKILFPNDPLPSSPYLDFSVSEEVNYVRELFLAEAPEALNTAIAQGLPGGLPEHLRARAMADIAERVSSVHVDVFERVLNRMRESSNTSQNQGSRRTSHQASNVAGSQTRRSSDSGLGSSLRGSAQGAPPQEGENAQTTPIVSMAPVYQPGTGTEGLTQQPPVIDPLSLPMTGYPLSTSYGLRDLGEIPGEDFDHALSQFSDVPVSPGMDFSDFSGLLGQSEGLGVYPEPPLGGHRTWI